MNLNSTINNYKRIQIITNKLFFGALIDDLIVSHLYHLQADLNFINELSYLKALSTNKVYNVPSFFFVDTQDESISSEVPTISENLNHFKTWNFFLNGKNASVENFRIYCHFFPFDLLLISGHGASPDVRLVSYLFKSSDGKEHTVKVIEYFQLGRKVEDKIELHRKQYPLEIDGIDWRNKKLLKKNGLSHMLWEFSKENVEVKFISAEKYHTDKIEGIRLHNGVFLGEITSFEQGNNPVIILNTCGSLVEAGEMVNFGLPRVLIGTMWSVYDSDAKKFAIDLFNNINDKEISAAFQIARNQIATDYSKYAYVYIGTLNQYLPIQSKIPDSKLANEQMANRLINSITRAVSLYQSGHLDPINLEIILKFETIIDRFITDNFPSNNEIRKNLSRLKNTVTPQS